MAHQETPPPNPSIAQLRRFVGLLAATAVEQQRWLDAARLPVDEMFLQLVDARDTYVWTLVEIGAIDESVAEAVASLTAELDAMDGPNLWTRDGLTDPAWAQIRRYAAEILDQIPPVGDSPAATDA